MIADEDILPTDLINFDNLESLNDQLKATDDQQEDFANLSLKQAINRLFRFIEIESNISLERLDGTYLKLKEKVQEKVKEAE